MVPPTSLTPSADSLSLEKDSPDVPIWTYDVTYVGSGERSIKFATSGDVIALTFAVAADEEKCICEENDGSDYDGHDECDCEDGKGCKKENDCSCPCHDPLAVTVTIGGVVDIDTTDENEKHNPGTFIAAGKRVALVISVNRPAVGGTVTLSLGTLNSSDEWIESGLSLYNAATGGSVVTRRTWDVNKLPANLDVANLPPDHDYVDYPATLYVGGSVSGKMRDKRASVTWTIGENIKDEDTTGATVYKLTLEAPGKTINLKTPPDDPEYAAPVMLNDNQNNPKKIYGRTYTIPATPTTSEQPPTWDCSVNCPGNTSAGSVCVLGHRELEPVWDLHYIGQVNEENDLLHVSLSFAPAHVDNPPLDVKLTLSGKDKVRLWKAANKGQRGDIIDDLPTYKTHSTSPSVLKLPANFYVEGINIGASVFTAEVELPNGKTVDEKLTAHVVSLVEDQGGRKVIYECSPPESLNPGWPNPTLDPSTLLAPAGSRPIKFTVMGGEGFNGKGLYKWTVPNRILNVASFPELPPLESDNSISVSYGQHGSLSRCDIEVTETEGNRRFTSTVSVSIGHLELTKTVRVALNTYPGTPLPKPNTAGYQPSAQARMVMEALRDLDNKYNWHTNPPAGITFDDIGTLLDTYDPYGFSWIDPTDKAHGYYRLFYHPGEEFAALESNGRAGTNLRFYWVRLGPKCWEHNYSTRILDIVLKHEFRHQEQFIKIRTDNTSLDCKIDEFFKDGVHLQGGHLAGLQYPDGLFYYEIDAQYHAEISNQDTDFRLLGVRVLATPGRLDKFAERFNAFESVRIRRATDAKNMIVDNPELAGKVKTFLQGIYNNTHYPEMKRYKEIGGVSGYDINFRAPE